MRGENEPSQAMFCYVSPEGLVPKNHPLRPIKSMADAALKKLSPKFDAMYSHTGRPSIPPEKLLKASLLQAFYTVRSERQLVEQIGYNILFRWFLDMALDEKPWDATVFTKNRDRLLKAEISAHFFAAILEQARSKRLLSDEHFTVDGTLIEAWASIKSFRPKDGPPQGPIGRNEEVDFRGQKLSNATHASVTDPDAKLYRKSSQQGADKGYDTQEFVSALQELKVTPHVAQNNTNRSSTIDGRTTRHEGYKVSQRIRKRVEEIFGWMKTVGNCRSPMYRGTDRVGWHFTLVASAYNLVRMRNLLASPE